MAAPGFDPPGANGTVQIDGGPPFDQKMDNEPHVSCDFAVDFHNFDDDERANIVFTLHPPTSSSGPGIELLRVDNVLISDDPADGANPDPDELFEFTTSQLGLDAFTPHPKQGFHIKLTVERIGAPGAGKHKVFWVQECVAPTTPTSPPPTGSETPTPSESTPPGGNGLPVTGAGLGGVVAAGLGLVAAGSAAVVFVRRRRSIGDATES
jgi:LPXTG-motif cell wall-anchored protein